MSGFLPTLGPLILEAPLPGPSPVVLITLISQLSPHENPVSTQGLLSHSLGPTCASRLVGL